MPNPNFELSAKEGRKKEFFAPLRVGVDHVDQAPASYNMSGRNAHAHRVDVTAVPTSVAASSRLTANLNSAAQPPRPAAAAPAAVRRLGRPASRAPASTTPSSSTTRTSALATRPSATGPRAAAAAAGRPGISASRNVTATTSSANALRRNNATTAATAGRATAAATTTTSAAARLSSQIAERVNATSNRSSSTRTRPPASTTAATAATRTARLTTTGAPRTATTTRRASVQATAGHAAAERIALIERERAATEAATASNLPRPSRERAVESGNEARAPVPRASGDAWEDWRAVSDSLLAADLMAAGAVGQDGEDAMLSAAIAASMQDAGFTPMTSR